MIPHEDQPTAAAKKKTARGAIKTKLDSHGTSKIASWVALVDDGITTFALVIY
ncbi:hypothetical protein [Bradyrhizobium sp. USDA 4473]